MKCLEMPRRDYTLTSCGEGWSAWHTAHVVWADMVVVVLLMCSAFCEEALASKLASAGRGPLMIRPQAAAALDLPHQPARAQTKQTAGIKPDKLFVLNHILASPGLQARNMHHQLPIVPQPQPCRALTEEARCLHWICVKYISTLSIAPTDMSLCSQDDKQQRHCCLIDKHASAPSSPSDSHPASTDANAQHAAVCSGR